MTNLNPADIEFAQKSMKLAKAVGNPFMSPDRRRAEFVKFVDSLSDETFMIYRDKILDKVNPSESTAKQSKNTEDNVKAIIAKLPRLELLKSELTERVKKSRKSYGLEV
jgi:hypothetical protein